MCSSAARSRRSRVSSGSSRTDSTDEAAEPIGGRPSSAMASTISSVIGVQSALVPCVSGMVTLFPSIGVRYFACIAISSDDGRSSSSWRATRSAPCSTSMSSCAQDGTAGLRPRGLYVHGRPGERFIYPSWGDVDATDTSRCSVASSCGSAGSMRTCCGLRTRPDTGSRLAPAPTDAHPISRVGRPFSAPVYSDVLRSPREPKDPLAARSP